MVSQSTSQNAIHNEILVEIQNSDNRPMRMTRHPDGHVKLGVDEAKAQKFRLTMMDPDLFALRTADTHELLSVTDSGRLSLQAGMIGHRHTFQLVRSTDADTHFGFRFGTDGPFVHGSDDQDCMATASAADLDAAARFTFAPVLPDGVVAPAGHHHCCCGPAHSHAHDDAESANGDGGGALWNDYTHFRIVEVAVHYLRNMENPTPEAQFISAMWDRGAAKIAEGLKGADYWPYWMPIFPLWALYYYHFYNPDTGSSFPWPSSWYPHNAVSCGSWTFDDSVRLYREGPQKHDDAFVQLGLSLHFLTDLCQPMHAANFVNNPLVGDWRHSGYEAYAEEFVEKRNFFQQPGGRAPIGGYPPIRRDEVENTSPSARGWLLAVADQSLKTWKEVLGPAADKKVVIVPGPNGGNFAYFNDWTAAEADPSLMRSLWLAPRNTARYLCMWASRVRQ